MTSLESIYEEAGAAYYYARNIVGDRFSVGEAAIAKHAAYSFYYARDILYGRFHEGEPVILTKSNFSFAYANHIIKGRWPEGEPIIAADSRYSYFYSKDVIKERFPLGEESILESDFRFDYVSNYYSINDFIDRLKIEPEEQLILKLKYNDKELKNYLISKIK